MAIVTFGIDLAKNVFAVYGVDETGSRLWCDLKCHAPNCSNSSPICRRA